MSQFDLDYAISDIQKIQTCVVNAKMYCTELTKISILGFLYAQSQGNECQDEWQRETKYNDKKSSERFIIPPMITRTYLTRYLIS